MTITNGATNNICARDKYQPNK